MGSSGSKPDQPRGGIYSPEARAPLSTTVYTDPTSTVNTESGGFHLVEFHGETLSSAGLIVLAAAATAWIMVRLWRWMRDRAIKRHIRAQAFAWHTSPAWGQFEQLQAPLPMPYQRFALQGPAPPPYVPPPRYNPYHRPGQPSDRGPTRKSAGGSAPKRSSESEF